MSQLKQISLEGKNDKYSKKKNANLKYRQLRTFRRKLLSFNLRTKSFKKNLVKKNDFTSSLKLKNLNSWRNSNCLEHI